MNYFIIGMMGSWKSTVSKLLASNLQCELIDIDRDIQHITGLSISEIFELYGERRFRDMESKYFEEISKEPNRIISTGGGIVLSKNNREILKSSGTTFYLKASADSLSQRIKSYINRPLLNQGLDISVKNQLSMLLNEREQHYLSSSNHIIETDQSNPHDIAQAIESIINDARV